MAWIEPSPEENRNHKGPWYVRFRDNGAKQRSGPFWHLPEARDEKAKRHNAEREARKNRIGHVQPGMEVKALFKRYLLEEVQGGTLRQSTADQKERMLMPYLEKCRSLRDLTGTFGSQDWGMRIHALKSALLTDPSPVSVARAKREGDQSLLQPYSSSTVSIILRALQTFLEWCKVKKYIPTNPMQDFPMPRTKERSDRLRSKDDREKIFEAAKPALFRLYLEFLAFHGQRRSTTLMVEGHQLDLKERMWHIPEELTKEGYPGTVPLHPRVVAALQQMYPKALPPGRLFPFTYADVTYYWRETRKAAALPYHITLHGLRRTWASGYMRHTQNLKAVMQAGLWKDAKTAMKYQHLQADWLKQQTDTFDF